MVKEFFSRGEAASGTTYFFTKDHLGSVREMGHMSGSTFVLDSQFSFDPWGQATQVAGSGAIPDFGYANMYIHSRSGRNLTWFREYEAPLGRWLSRDPIGELSDEGSAAIAKVQKDNWGFFVYSGKFDITRTTLRKLTVSELPVFRELRVAVNQVNLYIYCANDPINHIDWSGRCFTPRIAPPTVDNTSPTLAPPPPEGYGNPKDNFDPGAPQQLVPGPQTEAPLAPVPGATPTPPGMDTGF